MAFDFKAEWPIVKGAPATFISLGLSALIVGGGVGLWIRAEQVSNANLKVEVRDDKIKKLEDELSVLRAAAKAKPTEQVGDGQTDKSEAPGTTWPFDPNNRDNDMVETGKPKDESPGFKTAPMPNN